jgi:signal transduction histidine kinase
VNVVLTDLSGRQLLNTLRPFGAELPEESGARLAQIRRVIETRQPETGDLFVGAATRKPVLAVDVPVMRDGEVIYVLTMGIFPERLGDILAREGLREEWVASIFDSQGTIVARTHEPARYVGEKGAPRLLSRMTEAREGWVDTPTLEGIPVIAVFSHSTLSNWAVAIGIPSRMLAANLWKPVLLVIGLALSLLFFGMGLAGWISGRLSGAIRSLIAPAVALGRGQAPIVPPLRLEEAAELGRALLSASNILRQRERTLAFVAHDLRSPLNAVMIGAELIERTAARLPGCADLKDPVSILKDTTRRMAGMVDDLLAVAVSTDGERSMLALARVDASSLVARAANAVRGLYAKIGIELRVESPRSLPPVMVDADRIVRVFANVLDNALKFTEPGGHVVLHAEASPDAVRFCIANTGPELSPAQLDAMFRPFWQAGEDHRGAGLGLSICRSIIETHGGTIWAEPAPGMRVRICFDLPREPAPSASAATAAENGAMPALSGGSL